MRRFFIVAFVFTVLNTHAQDEKVNVRIRLQSVSAALHFPLGNFSETHLGGMGFQYSWFGKGLSMRPVKRQSLMFSANGGVSVYAGKKEKVVTASYKYPVFTLIHAYGGAAWRPSNHFHIAGYAGPALGIYNGNTSFNLGGKLDGQYYITDRLSLGPSLQLMKEKGSDPLWAGSLGLHYYF